MLGLFLAAVMTVWVLVRARKRFRGRRLVAVAVLAFFLTLVVVGVAGNLGTALFGRDLLAYAINMAGTVAASAAVWAVFAWRIDRAEDEPEWTVIVDED